MKKEKLSPKEKIFLLAIFLLAFLLRLYKIQNPVADWHSWRQADTASVSKNLIKSNFDLLHPRFHDLSSIPSGKENPLGWRFVEFPVYNFIHAGLFKLVDVFSFDVWGRLTSVFASLFSLYFLFLLTAYLWDKKTALFAALFFGVLPFNVYYSRTILPGPLTLTLSLGAIYFFLKFTQVYSYFLALIFMALALLAKPYSVFITALPLAYLSFNKLWKEKKNKRQTVKDLFLLVVFVILSFLPFLLWRLWMRQFPEGIPANRWLFNAGGMRLKPVWWRWLFYERIAKLILGGWGTVFLVLGLIAKKNTFADFFYFTFAVGALLFLVIFARGNIQHDYYQLIIIPALSLYLGRGVTAVIERDKKTYPLFRYLFLAVCLVFTFAFSYFEIRGYYQINNPAIIVAGQAADKILPAEAKVIAPYQGDTAFLYQTNRPGWPAMTGTIEEMIKKGATHYVSANFDETTKEIMDKYQVVEKTDSYVIVRLILKSKTQN